MKKILTISLGLLLTGVTIAQSNDQIQNKKGVDIMPVKGEWALGAGFNVLGFVGNMFTNTNNNSYANSLMRNNFGGQSIFGKYMISDNNAVRVSVFNAGQNTTTKYKAYDDKTTDPDSLVFDVQKYRTSSTRIGVGYEFRKGSTRLRGIYGADAFVGWGTGQNYDYTYGNAMTFDNQAPYSINPNGYGSIGVQNTPNAERIVSVNNSNAFNLGLRGFIGVEYFIAPKICIGTEFGWNVTYTNSGDRTVITEKYDIFANDGKGGIELKEVMSENGRSFRSGLDNTTTQLYFTFYF